MKVIKCQHHIHKGLAIISIFWALGSTWTPEHQLKVNLGSRLSATSGDNWQQRYFVPVPAYISPSPFSVTMSYVDPVSRLNIKFYFHIRQLRSICRSLTIDACHALVRAMVLSRFDSCNGLLGGAPKYLLGQMSGVMEAAARLITSSCFLREATWLTWSPRDCTGSTFPHESSSNSVCLLFGVSTGLDLFILIADYFIPVVAIEGRPNLRSAATSQLLVPRTKTVTIGPRTVTVCSPTVWNNLSVDLRDPYLSFSCFREILKTYLFKLSSTLWFFSSSNGGCALLAAFATFYGKHLITIICVLGTFPAISVAK